MQMKSIKKKVYDVGINFGIWFLKKYFTEYFAAEPLQCTDRYVEYPFVLENLPKPPCKVLDVGCSGSIFPYLISSIGYETTGIDIRNYYPTEKFFFVKGDIKTTMFDSGHFDVITAISSLEHIGLKGIYGITEDDMDGDFVAVKEIHRILKPGGLFLMTVPYDEKLAIKHNHKIYTIDRIKMMLKDFKWEYKSVQSSEAEYKVCLAKAIKK